MNFLNLIFLDGSPAADPAASQSPYTMWIMLGLLMVVFYFFIIRPQSKRQKELNQFRESLQEGTKVVTVGGIHGKVTKLKDDNTVLMEIANNVIIKVDKGSIVQDGVAAQQAQQAKK